MFRSFSLDWGEPFSWGPGFLRGAGESTVALSLVSLARFSPSAREFLSFIPCVVYFCTSWWCNIYVILCHSLWWLSTCSLCWNVYYHVFSYTDFCIVLILSVHTWWYHRPTYVHRSGVPVSARAGRHKKSIKVKEMKLEIWSKHKTCMYSLYFRNLTAPPWKPQREWFPSGTILKSWYSNQGRSGKEETTQTILFDFSDNECSKREATDQTNLEMKKKRNYKKKKSSLSFHVYLLFLLR